MNNNLTLLMTACINPNCDMESLVISLAEERLNQYLSAIKFYIEDTSIQNIVFCDNSDFLTSAKNQMMSLAKLHNKHMEWISFEGDNKKVMQLGKGYGEGEIIDWAFSKSNLLQSTDFFLKVTGRLIISNIDSIIKCLDISKKYFLGDLYFSRKGIDTRLFGCPTVFYINEMRYIYKECDDSYGKILENLFYKKLYKKYDIYSFNEYPEVKGCSAGSGIDYTTLNKYKLMILNFLCSWNIYNKCFWLFYIPRMAKRKSKKVLQE